MHSVAEISAVRTMEATLSLSGLSLFKAAGYLELSVIFLCNASIVYAGGEPRDAPVCRMCSQNNGSHAESVGRAVRTMEATLSLYVAQVF